MRTATHTTTRVRDWGVLGSLVVATCLAVSSAVAAPSEREKQEAADLMDEGDTLLASGKAVDALDRYRRADRIMEVPTTRIAVAHALAKIGRLIEAREAAVETQRMPSRPKEPKAFRAAREAAAHLQSDLADRIPTLAVTIQGLDDTMTPTVLLDGKPGPEPGTPIELNPGRYEVTVLVPGSPDMKQEVELQEKERRTVVLTVTPPEREEVPKESGGTPTLAYVGFGVGIAGVAVGSVTGLWAMRRSTDLEDQCAGTVCPTSYEEDIASARTIAKVSNITFAIGLAGLAVGTGALLFGGDEVSESTASRGVRVEPEVGPLRLGVRGSF